MECATCGKTSLDIFQVNCTLSDKNTAPSGIKLKQCTACYSVRYCSVGCQRSHWREHKKECKKIASSRRAFVAALVSLLTYWSFAEGGRVVVLFTFSTFILIILPFLQKNELTLSEKVQRLFPDPIATYACMLCHQTQVNQNTFSYDT